MAITDIQQQPLGTVIVITATSDLTGTVYYHWYLDGSYVGVTTDGSRSFSSAVGGQARVEVIDTTDAGFDPIANAPDGYPSRYTVHWARSSDTTAALYRVEQRQDGGSWESIGSVDHDPDRWSYSLLTGVLVDLSVYEWRVVAVDAAGNDGSIVSIGPLNVARSPDAPDFTVSFDPGTTRVTFTEAA